MVYSTRDASLVYTMETVVKGFEGRTEGLDAATTPIAERMRRENLIR